MIDRKLIAQLARDTDAIFSDYRTGPWIQHFAELLSSAALAQQAQELDALRAALRQIVDADDSQTLCQEHIEYARRLIDTSRKEG